MSHSRIGHRQEVDSRLLVVGSQIASLTPGLSFAHNLGCRCPNGQCEGIFDIYVSRPFQRQEEHPNARCFAPCCRALNIRESRRTPNPQLFQVLGFTPALGQSGVVTPHKHKSNIIANLNKKFRNQNAKKKHETRKMTYIGIFCRFFFIYMMLKLLSLCCQ